VAFLEDRRPDCLLLAGALYVVDPPEPFSYSFAAPIRFVTADYVGSGSFANDEVNRATAHNASATDDEEAARPSDR
jgi:hypothetical protein